MWKVVMTKHTKIFNNGWFAVFALAAGLTGLVFIITLAAAYDTYLYAEFPYAVSGSNYVFYFTIFTNLLADIWLIAVGISILVKKEKMRCFLFKPELRMLLAAYLVSLSIVYYATILPQTGFYSSALWFYNLIDFWNHLIVPLCMTALLFFSADARKIDKRILALGYLYPAAYLTVIFINGGLTSWYPYPFFDPAWSFYMDNALNSTLMIALIIVALFGILGLIQLGALKMYNHRIKTSKER